MKQIVRLTESVLNRIVKQVITEAIDEVTGKQRNIIVKHGRDSAKSSVMGNPTIPSGRPTEPTLKQVAEMDAQSLYMMLSAFKNKPFSFVINYQGVDVVIEFWVEDMIQTNSKFTVCGTIFMKNGAKLSGRMFMDVITNAYYIKIKGDRHSYGFEPIQKSLEYWNRFLNELKNSI
ncbi:MAG: hypothetical protein MJZ28_03145 [Paludibacteraceae bacterium]|nr:hypothetical protein [Paludibacteraceae bacterium]